MLVIIPDLLKFTEIEAIQSVLSQCNYVDGKLSAGNDARKYKRNEEAAPAAEQFEALNNVVMSRLVQHPLYLNSVLPIKISLPIYARYSSGMAYGSHIDDPVMGGSSKYRSDVSITVFLNNPDEYEGGELTIETDYGSQNFKQNAGSAIIYPSSSRHEIKQVTRGERLVAIAWVQSMVRSAEQRQVLYQLHQAREQLSSEPSTRLYQQVNDSYANLVRMWAEI